MQKKINLFYFFFVSSNNSKKKQHNDNIHILIVSSVRDEIIE